MAGSRCVSCGADLGASLPIGSVCARCRAPKRPPAGPKGASAAPPTPTSAAAQGWVLWAVAGVGLTGVVASGAVVTALVLNKAPAPAPAREKNLGEFAAPAFLPPGRALQAQAPAALAVEPKPAAAREAGPPPAVAAALVDPVAEFDKLLAEVRELLKKLDRPPQPIVNPAELTSEPSDPDPKIAACRALIARRAETILAFAHPSGQLVWFDPDEEQARVTPEGVELTYAFIYRSIVDLKRETTVLRFRFDPSGALKDVAPVLASDRLGQPPFVYHPRNYLPPLARKNLDDHLRRKLDKGALAPERADAWRAVLAWLDSGATDPREGLVRLVQADDDELGAIVHFQSDAVRVVDQTTPRPGPPSAKLDFSNPKSAAQSFLNAVRARNPADLARCISNRSDRDADKDHAELLLLASVGEAPQAKLDELNQWLEGFVVADSNQKERNKSRVVLRRSTKKNVYEVTIVVVKERDDDAPGAQRGSAWQVVDLSEPKAKHQLGEDAQYAYWRHAVARATVTSPEPALNAKRQEQALRKEMGLKVPDPEHPAPDAAAQPPTPTVVGPSVGAVKLLKPGNTLDFSVYDRKLKVGDVLDVRRPTAGQNVVDQVRVVKIEGDFGEAAPIKRRTKEQDTLHRPAVDGPADPLAPETRIDWNALVGARVLVHDRPGPDDPADVRLVTIREFKRGQKGATSSAGGAVKLSPEESRLRDLNKSGKLDDAAYKKKLDDLKRNRPLSNDLVGLSVDFLAPGVRLRPRPERGRSVLDLRNVLDLRIGDDVWVFDWDHGCLTRTLDVRRRYVDERQNAALTNFRGREDDAQKLFALRVAEARAGEINRLDALSYRVDRRVTESLRAADVQFVNRAGKPTLLYVTALRGEEGETREVFQRPNTLTDISPEFATFLFFKNTILRFDPNVPLNPVAILNLGTEPVTMPHRGRPLKTSLVSYFTQTVDGRGPVRTATHEHFDEPFVVEIKTEDLHCETHLRYAVLDVVAERRFVHVSAGCRPSRAAGPYQIQLCDEKCLRADRTELARGVSTATVAFHNPTDQPIKAKVQIAFASDRWIHERLANLSAIPAEPTIVVAPGQTMAVRLTVKPERFRNDGRIDPPVVLDIDECGR